MLYDKILRNPDLPANRRYEIIDRIILDCYIHPEDDPKYSWNGSGCWIWQRADSGNGRGGGYPRMSLSGQTVAVHIVSYTHFFGYIPSKKQIDHLCCNRLCVNPNHLEMLTHKQNQRRRRKS